MRFYAQAMLAAMILGATAAPAEISTVVIPLDDLGGQYSPAPRQIVGLRASVSYEPPASLLSVTLRIVGTAVPGLKVCPDGQTHETGVEFVGWVSGGSGSGSHLIFDASTWDMTEFDLLCPSSGPNDPWPAEVADWFASGSFELFLESILGFTSCAYLVPYATATVTSVELIIEGDFSVATEASSWGEIKALFR